MIPAIDCEVQADTPTDWKGYTKAESENPGQALPVNCPGFSSFALFFFCISAGILISGILILIIQPVDKDGRFRPCCIAGRIYHTVAADNQSFFYNSCNAVYGIWGNP
jgi:hypothetical protein